MSLLPLDPLLPGGSAPRTAALRFSQLKAGFARLPRRHGNAAVLVGEATTTLTQGATPIVFGLGLLLLGALWWTAGSDTDPKSSRIAGGDSTSRDEDELLTNVVTDGSLREAVSVVPGDERSSISPSQDPEFLSDGPIPGSAYLREHWGDLWPEVLAEMEKREIDPDGFRPEEWHPYEVARPGVEETATKMFLADLEDTESRFLKESRHLDRLHFRWYDVNPERKVLSEDQLSFLREVFARRDDDLRDLAAQWRAELERAFGQVLEDQVGVEAHPYFLPAFAASSGEVISYRLSSAGWCVQISISFDSHPVFADLDALRNAIYRARDEEVAAHIALM